MTSSPTVVSIGAVCFGIVVGWITYRTLRRQAAGAAISDIAAVIGAVGGGVVTTLYADGTSDAFGWYSIGLLIGFTMYLIIARLAGGPDSVDGWLGDHDPDRTGN
ncbi:hypothetical protein ACWEOI_12705 [Nocardia sp. NPDC004340]